MKKATRSNRRFKSYDDLVKHTETPLLKRRALKIGREGTAVVPRKFHLSEAEVAELTLQHQATKRFPNPHNKGFYFYLLEALVTLGIDKAHSTAAVMQQVERLMSDDTTIDAEDGTTAWQRWASKEPRNASTAKDVEGRFMQNILVLQRLTGLTPYGRRILDVCQKVMKRPGGVIDVLRGPKDQMHLKLNTHSDQARNDFKSRGMGSPTAVAADRRAKAASKKRKGTAGTTKAR
ncbi:MAG: hypothetical protein QM754_15510 [Tepidisphaeraceae bacterium]